MEDDGPGGVVMSKDPDFISTEQFMKLPLDLKKQWWRETDSDKPPSEELKKAIQDAASDQ
jgi:hypothetical protein